MIRNFAVNARFLTRPASGVDRVAIELISALAMRADIGRLVLLHPVGNQLHLGWLDKLSDSARDKIKLHPLGRLRGHLWEQIELVRAQSDMPLLSLCSTGPVLRRNQVVMIHDAQVWDVPKSYSMAFRLAYSVLLPILARTARDVLTVSEFSSERLQKLKIAPRYKPKVILNGADHVIRISPTPDTLTRYGLEHGSYFLAIGSLAPHKNLQLLLEAASARPSGSPELIVVGGGDRSVFAGSRLDSIKGGRFIGRISDGELRALYGGAVSLVFPSLTEGFGLPAVEAMLCGCPVIATTGGAVPEVCGDAAFYVDPLDRLGWSAAMERIAEDADLRQDLSFRGLAHAQKLSWSNAADRLIASLTIG